MKDFTVEELFSIIPCSIMHKNIVIDHIEKSGEAPLKWSDKEFEWKFILEKEIDTETKEIVYNAGYALWGWEGIDSILPWTPEMIEEAWNIGLLPYRGGCRGKDLKNTLTDLYNWLKENNLL